MNVLLDAEPILALALSSLRVGIVLLLLPVLGGDVVPAPVRVLAAFAIGLLMTTSVPRDVPTDGAGLAGAVLGEAALGGAIGLSVRALLTAPRMAGDLVAQELGLRMAQEVDPTTRVPTTVVGRLYESSLLIALLAVNVHHDVIRGIHRSFTTFPVGAGVIPDSPQHLVQALVDALKIALQIALPMFGVLLAATLVLALITRAVPQLHIMNFGFGLRILGGLAASVVLFPLVARPLMTLLEAVRLNLRTVAGA